MNDEKARGLIFRALDATSQRGLWSVRLASQTLNPESSIFSYTLQSGRSTQLNVLVSEVLRQALYTRKCWKALGIRIDSLIHHS